MQKKELQTSDVMNLKGKLQLGAFRLDIPSKSIFRSEKFFQILGVDQHGPFESLDPFLGSVHQDDLFYVNQVLQQAKKKHGSHSFEFRVVRADRASARLHCQIDSIENDSEQVVEILGVILDLTFHDLFEVSPENTYQQLEDMIEFLPDATFAIDRDKKVVAWNRAIEEMTGTPKKEMLGKGDYEYSLPFYGKRRPILIDLVRNQDLAVISKYPQLVSTDGVLRAESFVRTAYKGKGAFLWGIAVPFFDSDGNWIGAIESIRDITDRKQAEEELKLRTLKLEETNTALKVLLRESSETKEDLENKVFLNVKKLVRPYLDDLGVLSTSNSQRLLIETLKTNLDQVASSFSKKISSDYLGLTPREIQIADLIRQGKMNKEIAEVLKITTSAIEFHRRNLRKKFNIKGEKVNLRSYLLSLVG